MNSGLDTDVLLRRLMAASQLRARVLSGNVANQNTPGYLRREVAFEEHLREALTRGTAASDLEPQVVVDTATPARPDGNNVDLEAELNAMRENRLLFETYAAIVEGRGSIKKAALGGNG